MTLLFDPGLFSIVRLENIENKGLLNAVIICLQAEQKQRDKALFLEKKVATVTFC